MFALISSRSGSLSAMILSGELYGAIMALLFFGWGERGWGSGVGRLFILFFFSGFGQILK